MMTEFFYIMPIIKVIKPQMAKIQYSPLDYILSLKEENLRIKLSHRCVSTLYAL
jgi:hypothetical protein